MAVDGSRTEITSSAPEFMARKYGATFGPGDTIAFSLLEPGPFHDLYAMRLAGAGLTRLTHNPEVDNESPLWVTD